MMYKHQKEFLKKRRGRLVVALVSLVAAYLMFLKATDTGSWGQYFLLAALLFIGINRLYHALTNL